MAVVAAAVVLDRANGMPYELTMHAGIHDGTW